MMRAAVKILAVTVAACFSMVTSSAIAGSYVVSACSPGTSPGLWAQTNTFPTSFTTGNRCGGAEIGPLDGGDEGGLYAEDILESSTSMPDGTRAGWTFSSPPGTTITSIRYYRTLAAHGSRDMAAGLWTADGAVLEQCTVEIPLGSSISCSQPNNQAPFTFAGLSTNSLFFGVMCRYVVLPGACGAGGTIHSARAVLYSARVTLSESSLPAVVNVGGPLWRAGVVSGVVPVTFAASDATGIKEQVVRGDDGKALISSPQACDFTLAQPCPQQPSGSLSVDTRRVSDGPHTFALVVTDAAGNSQVVTSPPVVVDNDGPPPPAAFTATAMGGGSNVIALAWRNPPTTPAPVMAAQVQLCQLQCPAAVTVSSSGAAQITAPGPGLYALRLWLLDSQGRGGAHNAALATVAVPAPPAGGSSSATRTRIAAVLRGRRLRVSGTIARTGRLRVSWRSKRAGRTLGSGSKVVSIRNHRLRATFTISMRARRGTTRIAVRSGRRIVAHARARRGS